MNYATHETHELRTRHQTWHERIDDCAEADRILSLARDFLATFTPEHLARLPAECRPGRIKGEDDVAYWSCRLAQYRHRDTDAPIDADLLQELLHFFLHAWVRLGEIQHTALPAREAQLH